LQWVSYAGQYLRLHSVDFGLGGKTPVLSIAGGHLDEPRVLVGSQQGRLHVGHLSGGARRFLAGLQADDFGRAVQQLAAGHFGHQRVDPQLRVVALGDGARRPRSSFSVARAPDFKSLMPLAPSSSTRMRSVVPVTRTMPWTVATSSAVHFSSTPT
jgi:hypothetical protein